jgi:hypothetical protein
MTGKPNPWTSPPAPTTAGGEPAPAPVAAVAIVQRRATDVRDGDVIGLPEEVFIADRVPGAGAWRWHAVRSARLPNAHRWRLVMAPDEGEAGLVASVPLGFRVLRVSDDHPDQGQEYRWRVVAVREHDLVDVQVTTPQPPWRDAGRRLP